MLASHRIHSRDAWLAVFAWALILRIIVAALTAGTFDPDEFVVLALSGAVAHGAVPYHSFMFFHPPGTLVLFAGLQPLIAWWWPSARVVTLVLDSATAVLVWRIGKKLYGDTEALVAGILYGASPVALISAVRIGPDPIITALGISGLALLLIKQSRAAAVLAGVCLALAVWTKYPALLFLPVYILAAPRWVRHVLLGCAITLLCLLAPFLKEAQALINETIMWQVARREHADLLHRVGAVGAYWLLLDPLGALALRWVRRPLWLPLGFCLGAVFLFTAQAYYHYFALCAPFGALLAAPIVTPIVRRSPRLVAAVAVGLSGLWAFDIANGSAPTRLFITASPLADAEQTAAVLDRATGPAQKILTDHFEYALFAHRPLALDYFWDMNTMVGAKVLERRMPAVSAVVATDGSNDYPVGFAQYLAHKKYPQIRTPGTVVWLVRGRGGQ